MELNYIFIPLAALATAVLGGMFTGKGVRTWYKTLRLPSWTPSGRVIGAIWTTLFILAACSALIVWNSTPHSGNFPFIIAIFLLNALVNVFWSYLFFARHNIFAAIWDAVLLDLTVVALIWLIAPVSALAAWLLVPYAAWTTLASYLNYRMYQLNEV